MTESIRNSDLRGAMQQTEALSFVDDHDPVVLPSVIERLSQFERIPDTWANKADRFVAAAPAIVRLADHMLTGEGEEARFRQPVTQFYGIGVHERLEMALADHFSAAANDESLDPLVRAGAERYAKIGGDHAKLGPGAVLKGADYTQVVSDNLYVTAKLMRDHPEISQYESGERLNIVRQLIPRHVRRQASMHFDDFTSSLELGELYQEGRLSLDRNARGGWQLSVSPRAEQEVEQESPMPLDHDTLELNVTELRQQMESIPQESDKPLRWRRLRVAVSAAALLLSMKTTAKVNPADITPVERLYTDLETEEVAEDMQTTNEIHETPPLVCPAQHRIREGEPTALERLTFAGINFAYDNGLFDKEIKPDINSLLDSRF